MVLLRHLLGDVLRRLRLRQGRTLREVSAAARVSLGYLSEVERGQKEASSELLAAICTALGTPLSHVLGEVSDSFALAELNSLLSTLNAGELREAIAEPLAPRLAPFLTNYIAAMVEYACAKRAVAVPAWVRSIPPLAEPVFGSELQSLRLHLLTHSPPPFRGRNIFIDATLGDRV